MSAKGSGGSGRSAMRVVKDLIVPGKWPLQIIAAAWTIVCVLILAQTLMAHLPRDRGDALEFQMIFMFMLSYPSGEFVYEALAKIPSNVWPYPESDIHTVLLLWIIVFLPGYFQWFVFPKLLYKACKTIVDRWRSGGRPT